ncbi:hypothetical protein [Pseudomonas sp.]|uniref:hypothetical protein n=1 Tax=Pseudomonas sp. TaxID=306 RepID=UPI002907EE42|nr:hypothetical protein [Pseudomonas sp.]MDU4254418.1 hypothetical protein [Pseudomonas sp.]
MSTLSQRRSAPVVESWVGSARALGIVAVSQMIEDQASALRAEMLDGQGGELVRTVYRGLPVLVPVAADHGGTLSVAAPGEGGSDSVEVSQLLAGLAITAHAAEYLYFGADHRFPVTASIKAYKYLVLAEAARTAADELKPAACRQYMEVLGVEW